MNEVDTGGERRYTVALSARDWDTVVGVLRYSVFTHERTAANEKLTLSVRAIAQAEADRNRRIVGALTAALDVDATCEAGAR